MAKNDNVLNWSFQFPNILKYYGFEHVWLNQSTPNKSKTSKAFIEVVKKEFFLFAEKFFKDQEAKDGTFASYISVNPNLKPPEHLNGIPDFHIRKQLTKLRIGDLAIETQNLRFYSDRNLHKKDLLCKSCNQRKCGDELHFIFECPYANDLRSLLSLSTDLNNSFTELVNLKDLKSLYALSRFVKSAITLKWKKDKRSVGQ